MFHTCHVWEIFRQVLERELCPWCSQHRTFRTVGVGDREVCTGHTDVGLGLVNMSRGTVSRTRGSSPSLINKGTLVFILMAPGKCETTFIFTEHRFQGRTQDFRRGGGARSTKEANKPNMRATGLKPRPCAHQGSMFRPY